MSKKAPKMLLNVLTEEQPLYESWLAYCLEFNLVTEGPSEEIALDRMRETIIGHAQFAWKNNQDPYRPTPSDVRMKFWQAMRAFHDYKVEDTQLKGATFDHLSLGLQVLTPA